MTRRRWILGATLVAVLVVAVTVTLDGDGPEQTQSRATALPSRSPSAPTTPSVTPSSVATPTPELTGEDFGSIVRSMEEFRTWLYEHPDPTLLKTIYDPDCPCYQPEFDYLQRLGAEGWRFDDEGTVILGVRVLDRPSSNLVVLAVTNRHGPERVVDSGGEVVERGDGWPKTTTTLTFERGPDGRWLLHDVKNPPS